MRLIPLLWLLVSPLLLAAPIPDRPPVPQFTGTQPGHWLNSPPLRREDLRGKVVLLDVWTFGCWNCYRSFPWLHSVESRFAKEPFQVIGIHSPEFAHERDREALVTKIAEFKITHPVMMDNDLAYWQALDNHYWPAFYLIDKQGRLRYVHVGETHSGDGRALKIEQQIGQLLAE